VSFAADRDEDLVQVSGAAQTTLPSLELYCVARTELLTPLADHLVGDHYTSLGQEILDVSETQSRSVVQPDCMADDLRRTTVTAIPWLVSIHPATLPVTVST